MDAPPTLPNIILDVFILNRQSSGTISKLKGYQAPVLDIQLPLRNYSTLALFQEPFRHFHSDI